MLKMGMDFANIVPLLVDVGFFEKAAEQTPAVLFSFF